MWWKRARLLPERPGRHHERLVDGRGRPRPAPAHAPPGLGRGLGVALGGPDRLQAGGRPAPPRPRERHRRGPRHPPLVGLRPGARDLGEEADGLPDLGRALPEGRPRGAHRPRAGVRGPGEAGAPRRGHADGRRALPPRHLPPGREGARRPLRRVGRGRAVEAPRERGGSAGAADPRRQGAALGGGALAGRQVDRPPRQGPSAVAVERREEDRHPDRHLAAGRRPGPRLVARQPLARLHRSRRQHARAGAPLPPRRGHDDAGDDRPLRQREPGLEPGRRVALLPVRPEPQDPGALAVGPAPARPLPRQPDRGLRGGAQEGRPLPVPAAGRAPSRGAEEGREEAGDPDEEGCRASPTEGEGHGQGEGRDRGERPRSPWSSTSRGWPPGSTRCRSPPDGSSRCGRTARGSTGSPSTTRSSRSGRCRPSPSGARSRRSRR